MNKHNWSVQDAIMKRVQEEDLFDWAQRPVAAIKYDYRPVKLQLSETAKHVFSKSIYFIKSLPKL